MSDWSRVLDLGHETTVDRALLKTPTTLGWVARITGTSQKYDLARSFVERVTPVERAGKKMPRGWNWFKIPGPGLYEYRKLGDGSLAGFFVIGWRGLRLVTPDEALEMAQKMK